MGDEKREKAMRREEKLAQTARRVGSVRAKEGKDRSEGSWVCSQCGGNHWSKDCPHSSGQWAKGMQMGMQIAMQALMMRGGMPGMPGGPGAPDMMALMAGGSRRRSSRSSSSGSGSSQRSSDGGDVAPPAGGDRYLQRSDGSGGGQRGRGNPPPG